MAYKKKNLKINFLARSFVGFVELGFSLVCFPYVARVLSPTSIGQVDFVNSTLALIITIGSFGVAEYGAREIAQNKKDFAQVDMILSKLLGFRLVLAVALFIIYLTVVVPFFGNGSPLFYISSLSIFSSAFNIVWALEAIEDFTFLAWSRLLSKVGFLAYLLLFVTSEKDVVRYMASVVGFDFLYFLLGVARLKFSYAVSFKLREQVKKISRAEIQSLARLLVVALIQTGIANIPSMVMGKMNLLHDLGLLSTAMRFFWIGFYALIPLSTVLLSRSMALSFDKESDERKSHLDRAFDSLCALSIPIAVGTYCIANDVINLLVGAEYAASVNLLQLLSPLIVIFAFKDFWTMQIVYSAKGDRALITTHIIALVLVLVLSFLLIPTYAAYGGVFTQLGTYISISAISYFYGQKYYNLKSIAPEILKILVAGLAMLLGLQQIPGHSYVLLVVKVIAGAAIFGVSLLVLRHKLTRQLLRMT